MSGASSTAPSPEPTPVPTTETSLGEYLGRWTALVDAWGEADDDSRAKLVRRALDEGIHWLPIQAADSASRREQLALETAIVRASRVVDPFGYCWHNQDLAWNLCGHDEELRHFVTQGWKELRHPSPAFDLWFYWSRPPRPHQRGGQPARCTTSARGGTPACATLPEVRHRRPRRPVPSVPVRRVCLFAGFDVDGVVDHDGRRPTSRPQPVRGRLLPRRLRARRRRARQAGAVHPRAAGRSATAATTSGPTPCWRATSSAGTSSRPTTSCSWPTTAATSCSPSTRSSPRMDRPAARLVGPPGDLRRLHHRATSSGSAAPCASTTSRTQMRTLDAVALLRLHPRRVLLRRVPVGA